MAVALAGAVTLGADARRLDQASADSLWDGVYTTAQATRGEALYRAECSRCHGATLLGGENAPPLAGEFFLAGWTGLTAADLYQLIRESMPSDSPGRLSTQQYADVLAYILQQNTFPAGARELPRDAAPLKQIRIEAKAPGC
jgi:mono/diheme cytochrome c family protein